MARATPPDLNASALPLRALARSYPRGLFIEPHQHEWGQLLYAMSGIMWVETPHEALVVPPQRGVWLPPGVAHGIRVVSELEMRNIYLSPELAQSLKTDVQVFEVRPLLRELILALVEQERQQEAPYYRALVELGVLELRRARRSRLRVPLPDGNDRRLLQLCQAVMANPSLATSFDQHAQGTGASVRTLARLLQRELGMGFAEWRRQVQLAIAAAALIEGRAVNRIAHELGYQPASFSEMFRRELGVTPSEYRAHGPD
ncbi:AraC family transcriptional regulator [Pseudomonas sp. LRF_L74]|uniref:AraC family transcriptional regulator n=1 Tax=Pseudomonas sp. LRF_L74 TaxID=3369422 RepID=UPI003F5E4C22